MKGYQKKVIYLKNTGSPIFDEAVFFVSREGEEQGLGQYDMVTEATRIIEESLGEENTVGRDARRGFLAFLAPFLLGVSVCSLAVVILSYFNVF